MARDLTHCHESYDLPGTETAPIGGEWPKQAQQNNKYSSPVKVKSGTIPLRIDEVMS